MKSVTTTLDKVLRSCFAVLPSVVFLLLPGLAYADPVGFGFCIIANEFTDSFAPAIATIAICTIGATACLGRIQWSTAVLVAVGITIIFGVASILYMVAGSNGNCHAAATEIGYYN